MADMFGTRELCGWCREKVKLLGPPCCTTLRCGLAQTYAVPAEGSKSRPPETGRLMPQSCDLWKYQDVHLISINVRAGTDSGTDDSSGAVRSSWASSIPGVLTWSQPQRSRGAFGRIQLRDFVHGDFGRTHRFGSRGNHEVTP